MKTYAFFDLQLGITELTAARAMNDITALQSDCASDFDELHQA